MFHRQKNVTLTFLRKLAVDKTIRSWGCAQFGVIIIDYIAPKFLENLFRGKLLCISHKYLPVCCSQVLLWRSQLVSTSRSTPHINCLLTLHPDDLIKPGCISKCPDGYPYNSCVTYIRDPCWDHRLPKCKGPDDFECKCKCKNSE